MGWVALAAVGLVTLVSRIAVVVPVGIAVVVGAAVMALTGITLKYTSVTVEHLHKHTGTGRETSIKSFSILKKKLQTPTITYFHPLASISYILMREREYGNLCLLLPVCVGRWGDLCNQKPGSELEVELEQRLLQRQSQ